LGTSQPVAARTRRRNRYGGPGFGPLPGLAGNRL